MPTLKQIANTSIDNTAYNTVYTNTTSKPALLKSLKVFGKLPYSGTNINPTDLTTTRVTDTSASPWTVLGSNLIKFAGQGTQGYNSNYGLPYFIPIELTEFVLAIWMPHHMHVGNQQDTLGGDTLHAQLIKETTQGYLAGPITNINIAGLGMNSPTSTDTIHSRPVNRLTFSNGSGKIRGFLLSNTKIALIIQQPNGNTTYLARLTIVNLEYIEPSTVVQVTLPGTSADIHISKVPGTTDKVLYGYSNGLNMMVQAYSIPDSGAISSIGTVFNTSLSHHAGYFLFIPVALNPTGTVNVYLAVSTTSGSAIALILFSFDLSNNLFLTVGTTVTNTLDGNVIKGIWQGCVSTNTVANLVTFIVTNSVDLLYYIPQTSSTQAAALSPVFSSPVTAPSPSQRGIYGGYNWGAQRYIIYGDEAVLYGYTNTGTPTIIQLFDNCLNNVSSERNAWIPFNTRPMYYATRSTLQFPQWGPQLYSRTGVTGPTNFGIVNDDKNYLPIGHAYGDGYCLNPLTNKYIIGQNTVLFSVDPVTGYVDSELKIVPASSSNWPGTQQVISHVKVTNNGTIVIGGNVFTVQYNTVIGQRGVVTHRVYTLLPNVAENTLNQLMPIQLLGVQGYTISNFTYYLDYNRRPTILINHMASATTNHAFPSMQYWKGGRFIGNWGQIRGNSSASFGMYGLNGPYRVIMVYPPTPDYLEGRWICIGSGHSLTLASASDLYGFAILTITNQPYSFLSTNLYTNFSGNNRAYWINALQSDNIQAVLLFDEAPINRSRLFILYFGNMLHNIATGYLATGLTLFNSSNFKFPELTTSTNGIAWAMGRTSTTANTVLNSMEYFKFGDFSPSYIETELVALGSVPNIQQINKTDISTYLTSTQKYIYRTLIQNTVGNLQVSLVNGAATYSLSGTPGYTINSSKNYQIDSTNIIPAGALVQLRTNIPGHNNFLLDIVEEAV